MTEKSDKRRRRGVVDLIAHIDPVGIVGILLSVILSVVLDLTNIATGVESLLSCLVGITLSLVLDSIARAERRFRIRSMLEAVPWFGESFFALAERTTNIARQFPNSRVLLEARQKYEALQDELDDLCRGRIVRSGNDYEHLLTGIQAATTIVEAATNVLPDGEGQSPTRWWQSDLGRHYWDLNLDAIRRGVRIIRIVTYMQMTDEIEELVALQRAGGVEVGLLWQGSVDPSLHLNFAVFDGKGAWEPRMNAQGNIVGNIFTINTRDIERIKTTFNTSRISANFTTDQTKEFPIN